MVDASTGVSSQSSIVERLTHISGPLLLQFSADGRSIVFLYRIGKCPRFFGAYFRTCAEGLGLRVAVRRHMHRTASPAAPTAYTCLPMCTLCSCVRFACTRRITSSFDVAQHAPVRGVLCLAARYVFTIDVTGQHLWRVPVVEGAYHDFGRDGRLLVADKVGKRVLPVLALLTTLLTAFSQQKLSCAAMLTHRGTFWALPTMASSCDD